MTPRYPANRGDRRAQLLACMLFAVVPIAALFAPRASADPGTDYAVVHGREACAQLAADSSDAGFDAVVYDMFAEDLNTTEATDALVAILNNVCPQFIPAAKRWAQTDERTYRA